MPRRPTKGAQGFYVELDAELHGKLKDLATRNEQTFKDELTAAVKGHLTRIARNQEHLARMADTVAGACETTLGERSGTVPTTVDPPGRGSIADAPGIVYKNVLARLDPEQCALAGMLRLGASYAQILDTYFGEEETAISNLAFVNRVFEEERVKYRLTHDSNK